MSNVSVQGGGGTTETIVVQLTLTEEINVVAGGIVTLEEQLSETLNLVLTAPNPSAAHLQTQSTSTKPVAGAVNIREFTPTQGATYAVGPKVQGIILDGSTGAGLIGKIGQELLVGNAGNDTIRGHGGSGTIVAGDGDNKIHSGGGNMLIQAGLGNDTIHTGAGNDTVQTFGSATVRAGAGHTLYQNRGGDATVYGSLSQGGFTYMEHGLPSPAGVAGNDTFIAGAGFNIMVDDNALSSPGSMTVDFNKTFAFGGTTLVYGFNSAHDSIHLEGYTVGQVLGLATVAGGSTYISLADGTKIEFVGVSNLTTKNFS